MLWRNTPEVDPTSGVAQPAEKLVDRPPTASSDEPASTDSKQSTEDLGVASSPPTRFSRLEAELVEAAAPVLRSVMPGLTSSQLASCAHLYALHIQNNQCSDTSYDTARDIVQESVRKLANFSIDELRQVHAASTTLCLHDPYLDRARYRRFPKALRTELWKTSAATTESVA